MLTLSSRFKKINPNLFKVVWAGLLILTLMFSLWTVLAQDTAEEHFYEGMLATRRGAWGDAIESFDLAIELDPEFAQAYFWRGVSYLSLGDVDAAADDFNQAIDLYTTLIEAEPSSAQHYLWRGRVHNEADNDDDALADFEQATILYTEMIDTNSEDAAAYLGRGMSYLFQGRSFYDEAVDDFTRAIEIDSEMAEAYYWRGGIHTLRDHTDKAITDFDMAFELDPDLGDFRAATTYLRKGLDIYLDAFMGTCGVTFSCSHAELNAMTLEQEKAVPYLCRFIALSGEAANPLVLDNIQDIMQQTGRSCSRN